MYYKLYVKNITFLIKFIVLEVSFFEFSKNQSNLNSNRSMIVNFSSTTLPGLARIGRPSQHWIRLNLVLGVNLSLQYRYYYIWVYGVPWL